MMFYLFRHKFFKWFLAFLGSVFFHILLGYYYFFSIEIIPTPLATSAVIMEFSDPPQSIFMPIELPVGPLQQISEEHVSEKTTSEVMESDSELAVDEITPPEVKPEIIVKQKSKESVKTKDKAKKIENKKTTQEKIKIVEKAKHKNKRNDLNADSPAGSNVATAPPPGNSNKIAAEFNSNSQGTDLEISWKGLVRAHLERNLRYPEQALKKRWKGVARINLTLDSQGNVMKVSLLKSSGKESFDREAIENAKRSSPLPKPPIHLKRKVAISLDIPVNFNYEKYRK